MLPPASACKFSPRANLPYPFNQLNGFSHRLVFVNYREDGMTPYFTFWKHGMNEMKV